MNDPHKTILVLGATGQQGGATTRHLLAAGWHVRALVRDPRKPTAQRLAAQGAELVEGDLDDRQSLDRAAQGVYGVFSLQTPFAQGGTEGEIRQGIAVADAVKAAGVQHFVYSSVGGADRSTGIPHFESKWAIEQHIRALDLPATILRPVFFMENFTMFLQPQEGAGGLSLRVAMQPDKSLQLIAVDDIGFFAAHVFAHPQEYIGQALELAGDELTMPQVAATWSEIGGRPVEFEPLPIEQVRSFSEDSARMFEWFNESGYAANIEALRRTHPQLKTFESWLGTPRTQPTAA